jgi:hypothetical protein
MTAETKRKILRGGKVVAAILVVYAVVEIGLTARALRQATQIAHLDGLNIEYLLSPLEFKALGELTPDYDVTSDGVIVLSSADRLWGVTPAAGGAMVANWGSQGGVPTSLAVDEDDTLLAITGGFFGLLGDDGELSRALPLPYDNARLARSRSGGAAYLFGGAKDNFRLYRFLEDGTLQVLLQSSDEIVAVADFGQEIYVATATAILQLRQGQPVVLFKAPDVPDWGPIISLVASPDPDLLFFATPSQVYAFSKNAARSVVYDSGGMLRLRADKLYVMDRTRGVLFAVKPASFQLFASVGQ